MIIIGTFAIIHRGYLDILDKYKDADIFILSDDLARELYKLEIDLRKMPITKVKQLLESLNRQVNILDKNNLEEIKKTATIVIIDDDVTEELRKKHLTKHPDLIIENGFFYHPADSVYQTETSINLIKNYSEQDVQFLKQALVLAAESGCFWRQVAAIIVKNKEILYSAYNQMLPNKDECYKIGCIRDNLKPGEKTAELCSALHSEANCIAQAAKDGTSLEDASIYVTTFPCPMCAKLIAQAGIKKCFYNTGWANFDGERIMQAAGVEIIKIDL
jgi:dCMP deaminase